MIARVWRGRAARGRAAEYVAHFDEKVIPVLEGLDGHVDALLLRRDDGDRTEFVAVTLWRSMDAIRAFAGDRPDVAVVDPAARAVLEDFDRTVDHYEVVSWGRGP